MAASLSKKLDVLEPQILAQTGSLEPTVYGVIDSVILRGGIPTPNVIRKWKGTIGELEPTDDEPTVYLVEKFEKAITTKKKYKCFFGGRGGMKTRFAQSAMISDVHSSGSKIYALRERMTALKDSIYSGIETNIKRAGLGGFIPRPSKWEIINTNGGKFSFGGMQNIIDMKGTSDFKRFLMEEAENTKQSTIDTLGPTLRDVEGAELWYLWNTGSSQDPMSKEFIIPYQAQLDKDGIYEDEYHLIIKTTYEDNPWFKHDESLQAELEKDREKVKKGIMTQSRFNGIWNGAFNDDVATSIIKEDWFKACIDAHKKLGFEPKGARVVGGDPSDTGVDPFGYVGRYGVVVQDVREIGGENGNRKMDQACRDAIAYQCDYFGYDADGLGATLRDNVSAAFAGKKTNIFPYKGSSSIDNPNAQYKSETASLTNSEKLKNKDVLYNRKSQNVISMADRIFRTWDSVTNGVYHDPETLVSFDSETIDKSMLEKLKAEACKTPLKPGNTIKFYTKQELRSGIPLPDGSRLKVPSPNLFDALVLSFDSKSQVKIQNKVKLRFDSIC